MTELIVLPAFFDSNASMGFQYSDEKAGAESTPMAMFEAARTAISGQGYAEQAGQLKPKDSASKDSNADGHLVTDKAVQGWIDRARGQAVKTFGPLHVTMSAWKWLYDQRQTHPNTNLALAAAEHYMYNRYESGRGIFEAGLAHVLTPMYYLSKGIASLIPGAPKLLSTDGRKPSTPTLESYAWAMKGIKDGRRDAAAQEEFNKRQQAR